MVEAASRILQRAAQDSDWNACREAVGELLAECPAEAALHLVESRLRNALMVSAWDLESKRWAEQMLQGGTSGRPPPPERPEAGGNSLVNACESFALATHTYVTDERVAHLTNALAELIMSQLLALWGANHSAQWTRWYDSARSGESLGVDNPLLSFRQEPDVRDTERSAWLELGEALSKLGGSA